MKPNIRSVKRYQLPVRSEITMLLQDFGRHSCPRFQLIGLNQKVVRESRVQNNGEPRGVRIERVLSLSADAYPQDDLIREDRVLSTAHRDAFLGLEVRQVSNDGRHVGLPCLVSSYPGREFDFHDFFCRIGLNASHDEFVFGKAAAEALLVEFRFGLAESDPFVTAVGDPPAITSLEQLRQVATKRCLRLGDHRCNSAHVIGCRLGRGGLFRADDGTFWIGLHCGRHRRFLLCLHSITSIGHIGRSKSVGQDLRPGAFHPAAQPITGGFSVTQLLKPIISKPASKGKSNQIPANAPRCFWAMMWSQ